MTTEVRSYLAAQGFTGQQAEQLWNTFNKIAITSGQFSWRTFEQFVNTIKRT